MLTAIVYAVRAIVHQRLPPEYATSRPSTRGRRATTLWTDALAFGKYYLFENYLRNKGCRIGRLWRPALLRFLHAGSLTRTGAPARLGGTQSVCHCLEQAVRGGAERTAARTFAPIPAAGERPRVSGWCGVDWLCLLRSLPRRWGQCSTAWGGEKEGINPIIETKVQEGQLGTPVLGVYEGLSESAGIDRRRVADGEEKAKPHC